MSFRIFFHHGLRKTCPACGKGKIFDGLLKFKEACPHCGLKLDQWAAGDAPAFFVMSFVITVVPVIALIVEMQYSPPLWLHALLWAPLTLGLSLGLLPFVKAGWLALEYKNKTGHFEKKHNKPNRKTRKK